MARVSPTQRLPGTYHTIESVIRPTPQIPTRGRIITMLPLSWFEPNKVVEITAREWLALESPGPALSRLGMASTPEHAPYNRGMNAMMDNAAVGLIFPQNTDGAKAAGVTADDEIEFEAVKFGAAGNKISVNIVQQDDIFTVTTFFNATTVDVQRIEGLADLQANAFVQPEFTMPDDYDPATDPPIPLPLGEVKLQGGADGTIPAYSARQGAFQQAAALEYWDVIAFNIPADDAQYTAAVNNHIQWLNGVNRFNPDTLEAREARASYLFNPGTESSDNANVFNIKDICRFDGEIMTPAEMVLWLAGLGAGTAANRSLTNTHLRRSSDLQTRRPEVKLENDINTGFMALHLDEDGDIRILREINSFVRTRLRKNIQWTDGKTGRVRHAWLKAVDRKFRRYYKGDVDDTAEERENFRVALSVLAELFQDNRMIYQHDISKIAVEPGGFKIWRSAYHGMVIPATIDTLDMLTTIQW